MRVLGKGVDCSTGGVSADAVEKPIIELLKHLFTDATHIESLVRKHVKAALKVNDRQQDRARLAEELADVRDRLTFIYGNASKKERDDPKTREVIRQLQLRRDAIDDELSLLPVKCIETEVANFTPKVIETLADFGNIALSPECYRRLRLLVGVLCRDFVVDMETLEATVEVGIPERLLRFKDADIGVLIGSLSKDHLAIRSANNLPWVKIASFRLIPPIIRRKREWPVGALYTCVENKAAQINRRAA